MKIKSLKFSQLPICVCVCVCFSPACILSVCCVFSFFSISIFSYESSNLPARFLSLFLSISPPPSASFHLFCLLSFYFSLSLSFFTRIVRFQFSWIYFWTRILVFNSKATEILPIYLEHLWKLTASFWLKKKAKEDLLSMRPRKSARVNTLHRTIDESFCWRCCYCIRSTHSWNCWYISIQREREGKREETIALSQWSSAKMKHVPWCFIIIIIVLFFVFGVLLCATGSLLTDFYYIFSASIAFSFGSLGASSSVSNLWAPLSVVCVCMWHSATL